MNIQTMIDGTQAAFSVMPAHAQRKTMMRFVELLASDEDANIQAIDVLVYLSGIVVEQFDELAARDELTTAIKNEDLYKRLATIHAQDRHSDQAYESSKYAKLCRERADQIRRALRFIEASKGEK